MAKRKYKCPDCGSTLTAEEGELAVPCPGCKAAIKIRALLPADEPKALLRDGEIDR